MYVYIYIYIYIHSPSQDLRACLERYAAASGASVDWERAAKALSARLNEGDAPSLGCGHHFAPELAAKVRREDGPLFALFGYEGCCGGPARRPASAAVRQPSSAPAAAEAGRGRRKATLAFKELHKMASRTTHDARLLPLRLRRYLMLKEGSERIRYQIWRQGLLL